MINCILVYMLVCVIRIQYSTAVFSNFGLNQTYMAVLSIYRFARPTPKITKLVALGWVSGICISNKCPSDNNNAISLATTLQSTNFVYKEEDTKHFRLVTHRRNFSQLSQLRHCSSKADIDNMQTDDHGCIPINVYLTKNIHEAGFGPQPQFSNLCSRAGFFNLGIMDILEWIIICCEELFCALQQVQQHTWPLPTRLQKHLPRCDKQKVLILCKCLLRGCPPRPR